MWQQYDPGTPLDRGNSVKIRVSKGPEPEPTTQPAAQPTVPPTDQDDDDDE